MVLTAGDRLGPYEILGLIGAGGMGEVYKARDARLGRPVAIKVLPAHFSRDVERRARFEREARAASALNHPNLCTVYDIGEQDGVFFIAMEWIDGQPLAAAIPPNGLAVDRALAIGRQVAAGLAAAHRAGILHRDIKPANILVCRDGSIRIADFGLAKTIVRAEATTVADASEVGVFVGTPGYAAPEQVRGAPVDARTDVFALGCVLYELFTGRRAFGGASGVQPIAAVIEDTPLRPRTLRRAIPRSIDTIVMRAIDRAPAARYPSAVELLADLDRVEAGRLARRVPLLAALRRPVAIAVLTLLVVAAFAGVALLRRARARERWVRGSAIPEASALLARGQDHAFAALRLLQRAEALTPEDPQLRELIQEASMVTRVSSDPPGADIFIRDFHDPADRWEHLGRAPLTARVPAGTMFLWKIALPGFLTRVLVGWSDSEARFSLVPADGAPPGMVPIRAGTVELYASSARIDPFWIDATEVTNRAFSEFVRSGGYDCSKYWRDVSAGACATFVDRTGRQGPATWIVGAPPDGQEDHPVGGVSAYEAAAYCRSVGKDLPTLFHWYHAARPAMTTQWAALSNFQSAGTQPVGRPLHLNTYGTFDMAGNVREWTRTDTGAGARYTLGGSFSEASYMFWDPWTAPPLARDAHLGFRCAKYTSPLSVSATTSVAIPFRDYNAETPAPDPVFATVLRFYDYDRRRPLDAQVQRIDRQAALYTLEQVSFAAAYGTERVRAFLLLPKNARPPYQAAVWFSGSPFVSRGGFSIDAEVTWLLFLVRSGRAVVIPEYKGSFERGLGTRGLGILDNAIWREMIVHAGLDLRRTLDYLETRDDIDARKIAYYGLSLGAAAGGIMTAIEPRFRASILLGGGLYPWNRPPEVDIFNFLPRVRVPTLMINGEHDTYFNLRGSQTPMARWLGTREKDHLVLPSGHVPSERDRWVGAILAWLDKYLGPVEHQR